MAATCGNGYVFDKLLKKKKKYCSQLGRMRQNQMAFSVDTVREILWLPDEKRFICEQI